MPLWAISLGTTLYNKTGTWRNFRPIYKNKTPPCNHACPANEKIQGCIDLINHRKYAEAWHLIKEDNPFPAVCGRVCFHPCETDCNRSFYDDTIAIHNIERFIGDYGLKKKLKVKSKKSKRKEKIAIIGGGPAGLTCAYFLARNGYRPTIFETSKKLGGLLAHGIPDYRLPKNILKQEINSILKLGVDVRTNIRVGQDKTLESIFGDHDATFIGTGAYRERKLNIPGEDTPGVLPALKFLRELNAGKRIRLGRKVAVIGGGNAAMDAARSVLRTGAQPIVIYRRTRNEMPAIPDEIHDAETEQIQFIFLAAPVGINLRNKKISSIECVRMKLGRPDESGRRRPIPVKGSKFRIKVDSVIPAIGEQVDLSFLIPGVTTTDWGIKVDKNGATNIPSIFAGGDTVTGPQTVVEAIGAGKKSAIAIIEYLRKKELPRPSDLDPHVVDFEELNTSYFDPAARIEPQKLPIPIRIKKFKEIYRTYSKQEVQTEADRCFSCGVCNHCDNCFVFCPDIAVLKKNGRYDYDYDYCKGCGVCLLECPRNAISLVEEKR